MAEVALGAAAAGGMLSNVWSYNRDNYKFDRTMQQSAMHQRQSMRKEWMTLFRDDVNQMVGFCLGMMVGCILCNTRIGNDIEMS